MFLILLSICIDFINTPLHQDSGAQIYTKKSLAICVLSGQCYLDQKGQSYCGQKGQFFLAKGVKFVWLFHLLIFELPSVRYITIGTYMTFISIIKFYFTFGIKAFKFLQLLFLV